MTSQPWWWIPSIVTVNALVVWGLQQCRWWPKPGWSGRLLRRQQVPTIESLKSGLSPGTLQQQGKESTHLGR